MRRKSADSTHIFIQFASDFQCYTEVISVVPQDISVKATHRGFDIAFSLSFHLFREQTTKHTEINYGGLLGIEGILPKGP